MDRKKLLALITRRPGPRVAPPIGFPVEPLKPDAVYQAAQAIRDRIDAALDASRLD